ncbi:hypothetical protein HCN44_005501 [Aphidius gifuensis]|uniref:Uncharacterized protein n=1 Tax=Aphidius gifuensis TaxID=684658 RepID=A0A834Y4V5_APHGI|nr:hypothetical protein HCN44_005501 [Aphidius gifuensis]
MAKKMTKVLMLVDKTHNDESCIKIISPPPPTTTTTTILITPPESAINFRINNKDIQTSFTKIFEDDVTQKNSIQ